MNSFLLSKGFYWGLPSVFLAPGLTSTSIRIGPSASLILGINYLSSSSLFTVKAYL